MTIWWRCNGMIIVTWADIMLVYPDFYGSNYDDRRDTRTSPVIWGVPYRSMGTDMDKRRN